MTVFYVQLISEAAIKLTDENQMVFLLQNSQRCHSFCSASFYMLCVEKRCWMMHVRDL